MQLTHRTVLSQWLRIGCLLLVLYLASFLVWYLQRVSSSCLMSHMVFFYRIKLLKLVLSLSFSSLSSFWFLTQAGLGTLSLNPTFRLMADLSCCFEEEGITNWSSSVYSLVVVARSAAISVCLRASLLLAQRWFSCVSCLIEYCRYQSVSLVLLLGLS